MRSKNIRRLAREIIEKVFDETVSPGLRQLAIVTRVRQIVKELDHTEPPKQETNVMKDEVAEKMRADLEWVKRYARTVSWVEFKSHIDGLLAQLPPKPEVPEVPEAPEGPYGSWLSTSFDGTWVVLDRSGKRIAADIPNQPTAELLASSWTLRRRLDAAEELLGGMQGQDRELDEIIDRYFKESGA